jgi:oligopeptide/dipeptide ABC transporter ATP-binding protein
VEESNNIILRINSLKKYFPVKSRFLRRRIGWLKAVDGVDFEIRNGEIFGIVGESGCGKSTLAKTILGIYKPTEGTVYFKGRQINNMPKNEVRAIRKEIQYVYQDPGASLDPWWSIGRSIGEPLKIHERISERERDKKIKMILGAVELDEAYANRYPHEFSGGQQRRIGLARVLVLNPSLIIFDESTAGLDVSVQATILNFFKQLKDKFGLTYMFISHDLAVIQMISVRVAVMYLGKVVEQGDTAVVFNDPKHPYTEMLLASVPQIEPDKPTQIADELIKGEPISPLNLPPGCRFYTRCPKATAICSEKEPKLVRTSNDRQIACHLYVIS